MLKQLNHLQNRGKLCCDEWGANDSCKYYERQHFRLTMLDTFQFRFSHVCVILVSMLIYYSCAWWIFLHVQMDQVNKDYYSTHVSWFALPSYGSIKPLMLWWINAKFIMPNISHFHTRCSSVFVTDHSLLLEVILWQIVTNITMVPIP